MNIKFGFLLTLLVGATALGRPAAEARGIAWNAIETDSLEHAQALLVKYSGEERQEIIHALKYHMDDWLDRLGSYEAYAHVCSPKFKTNKMSQYFDVGVAALSLMGLTSYFLRKDTSITGNTAFGCAFMLLVSWLNFTKSSSENKDMQQNLDMYNRIESLIAYLEK